MKGSSAEEDYATLTAMKSASNPRIARDRATSTKAAHFLIGRLENLAAQRNAFHTPTAQLQALICQVIEY